jgi:hypothetical protein
MGWDGIGRRCCDRTRGLAPWPPLPPLPAAFTSPPPGQSEPGHSGVRTTPPFHHSTSPSSPRHVVFLRWRRTSAQPKGP